MDLTIVFSLISAAAVLVLVTRRERGSEKIKLILGGAAVAAGLVAISLIAEKF